MFDELLEIIQDFFKKLLGSRLFALSVIFTLMFSGLIVKLFHMQILDGKKYQDEYMQQTEKSVTSPGTRGNIYDRNGTILAYNELAYSITIQDMGDYPRPADRNAMLLRLVTILDRRGEKVEGKLEIAMDADGEMVFTCSSDAAKKRFLLNFYGLSSSDKLDDAKGKYPSDITAREAFEQKKQSYGLDKMKDEKGNALVLPDDIALDIINIIYTMNLTRYQKYETTTVATNVTQETMTEINENMPYLKGVSVEQSYVRKYMDSIYFAPIIGYTGKVQEDQLAELNEQWRQTEEGRKAPADGEDKYNLNDVVGRTGIEKSMELELQGKKGFSRMYVDNMGRPREIIEQIDAKAGNDVYLTIDHDLQIAIYNLIEQQLAGILAYHLVNEDVDVTKITDSSKVPIPVKDAYYQLINNNVLSLSDMAKDDASPIEKEIYGTYTASRDRILASIQSELMSSHPAPMNSLPDDMSTYMNYIYSYLSDSSVGIIQRDKIDQTSEEYLAFREGTISLREYIYSGIAGSWVDTTKLDIASKYSDADDIFAQLVDYIISQLEQDTKFTKRMFRYLVNDGVITGNQLCLALFAQGVLAQDPQAIAALETGDSSYAFAFIKEKISNIELTPAQLALDPCTAGCVVTDVRTGEVRALVTYPSYDNNQMSGSVDAAYFAQLQDDLSRPLYNNATQALKAPGSTFKPITAVAALEEGVISTTDTIDCTGIYDLVSKAIRCWIFPGRHNAQTVEEGIQNSCNYFFSELAHRLSTKEDGTYSPEQGLETIRRYASMFGLDHTSGVEISENAPQLSTEDPERSAMGQGTHSFNNVQLSRYVAAIANRGTVFELSLLDKLTDSDGNLITDYTPAASNHVEAADSTWSAVQTGMRRVITNSSARSIFSDLVVEVAGKTGTAQEDRTRSNHAFFISFAPYSHPEIAVTVNIPFGYAGTNAATLGKKVYEYYYGYTTLEQILGSGALGVSNVTIGD
ncbi:penicillin-binding transpeptidase domain-containing protein [Lacrimispora sp. 210928-DFI.3.58]|uniref:penicillin-binding transpeptidase domain-containing protein n=1 Tax=Lacrimispora sp. 210928-DFI.3.58 TaxID=2883214 RepID=UPI001D085BA2|nr:penicillin-binding transpeptidase domain-containing protein [Lacrimispora sp. 210928-DFI.3.58]MCB7319066.1 penicillin-binding protein [Lacrimispora sp. 210928-DFI.3.58]